MENIEDFDCIIDTNCNCKHREEIQRLKEENKKLKARWLTNEQLKEELRRANKMWNELKFCLAVRSRSKVENRHKDRIRDFIKGLEQENM